MEFIWIFSFDSDDRTVGSGIRWTNLHPQKLFESMKSFNFNFPFETLDDFMKRVSSLICIWFAYEFLFIQTNWFSGRNHERLSGEAVSGPDGCRVSVDCSQQEPHSGKRSVSLIWIRSIQLIWLRTGTRHWGGVDGRMLRLRYKVHALARGPGRRWHQKEQDGAHRQVSFFL